MKPTRTAPALLLALFVASPARVALADPPPAEFTIQFDGDAAIWNPFEGFAACRTSSGTTTCLSLDNVFCDGAGECTGDAEVAFSGATNGAGSGSFVGRVRCVDTPNPNDPVCRARLTVAELIGSVDGCALRLDHFALRGPVDATGLYRARASANVCLQCSNQSEQCSAAAGRFRYQVNPPSEWTLTVDSHPSNADPLRLEGTADDSLGFTYTVHGVRSVGNGVSTLVLKGDAGTPSEGARVKLRNLVFHGEDLQAGTARIRVQGNKIREKLGH
jgi:hypothetical protein